MTITSPTHYPADADHGITPVQVPAKGPFEDVEAAGAVRGGANLYGAFSLETFCDVGGLSLTHDDAAGFLAYVEQFNPRNFWYQDAGVKIWAYYETYDNWQNTYGMDAVRAPYHSGHGGMDANGVFYVPMGAAWAGNDCTATSNNMRLGNEYARYVFWSTCLSLRVLDGHSPIRTWSAANLGLRMIFGFETVSYDDARYGSGFWNHWRNGESFSSAWMNSSWDIAHDQAPSVAACGATAQEAQDRVFNERYFYAPQASTAWWWWRWYNAAASAAREVNRAVPADLRIALLAPAGSQSVRAIAQRFDVDPGAMLSQDGVVSLSAGQRTISISPDGMLTARLADVNRGNRTPLARREAVSVADGAVRRYAFDADAPLVLDRVVELKEAGGRATGDGQIEGPFTTGTMVQYRQVVNGLPVITPSAGVVRVTVDNDGTVTDIHANTRVIDALSDRPRTTPVEPPPGPTTATAEPAAADPEAALARSFGNLLRNSIVRGAAPLGYSVVPGSTEVGYDVRGSEAILVARRAVEVEFEQGYSKRYWVHAPLFA